jgi:hypothetical protein
MGTWPNGHDPYRLGLELRDIVTRHGGTYLDILPDFRSLPNAERYYFPVDTHPDARGHLLISNMLAAALSHGGLPAFAGPANPPTGRLNGD